MRRGNMKLMVVGVLAAMCFCAVTAEDEADEIGTVVGIDLGTLKIFEASHDFFLHIRSSSFLKNHTHTRNLIILSSTSQSFDYHNQKTTLPLDSSPKRCVGSFFSHEKTQTNNTKTQVPHTLV